MAHDLHLKEFLVESPLIPSAAVFADNKGGQQGQREASWRKAGHGIRRVHQCHPFLSSHAHSAGMS